MMKLPILIASLATLAVTGPAFGQHAHQVAGSTSTAPAAGAAGEHESAPLYWFFRFNRLDYGASQLGGRGSWDIDARIGTDEHRLFLTSEGEYVRGKGEHAEIQLFYSRPITEFLDLQVGARQRFIPVGRSYLAIGIWGTLPWFVETEATLYISNKGQPSARVKAEVELAWTGRIITRPRIELNVYGSDDPQVGTYSGVGSVTLALNTRYQLTPRVAPYVEIGWDKALGRSGTVARQAGERAENAYAVVGVKLLY